MYSLVMLAAMTASPDVPQDLLCPVTPSKYGCGFWSKHSFGDCCAPGHYGWVNCWNKGQTVYPGMGQGYGHCGCATPTGYLSRPNCPCAPCGQGYGGGGGKGCGFCGYGWGIGCKPAYYSSVLGCPPCVTAPPYACYTQCNPCCTYGHFAFDTGLIGHSHGVGYSGFGGYGNFGFYGAVPMMHKPTTADIPAFPRPEYRQSPAAGPPAPMPPIPGGKLPPDSLLPKPPEVPASPPIPDVKKNKVQARPMPALVVLSVPAGATVSVESQTLASTGRERSFQTPELAPGQTFSYTVRARVVIAGREEVESKNVIVKAGETSRVSFEALFAKVEQPNVPAVVVNPRR